MRLDIELERAGLRHWRLVDDPGGDLHILAAQRGHHIAGGQVADREFLGVQPYAHGVIARTEDRDIADAVDPGEHVFDVQRDIVGDVE